MAAIPTKIMFGLVFGLLNYEPLDQNEWVKFKSQHGKTYSSQEEEIYRQTIYFSNLKFIKEHNELFEKGLTTFTLGMNHFGDLTHEEFAERYKGLRLGELPKADAMNDTRLIPTWKLPSSVDWRRKGAVTPVKNQGSCGSCWAFSTTGTLEGQLFQQQGRLISLSEQYLVDCSTVDDGCDGGWPAKTINFVGRKGIYAQDRYPYTGKVGDCKSQRTTPLFLGVKAYAVPKSEVHLQAAVANIGPISICIDVSDRSFQFYKSGVYYSTKCSPDNLNHAVLAVGYGTENGTDYWLVKNSWGTGWGEQGYIRMSRNKNNNCGVVSAATYPVLPQMWGNSVI